MRKYLTIVLLLLCIKLCYAQEAPKLAYFCELNTKIDPALLMGDTPDGVRRIIPIVGGTVTGPAIKGEILSGGADWQIIRKDGVAEIDARYQLKTDDGTIICISNKGLRVASAEIAAKLAKGEKVPAGDYYFRTTARFVAPFGKYEWLNNAVFICTGEKIPGAVLIKVWKVL